jgi:Cu2+-exporting ATPase
VQRNSSGCIDRSEDFDALAQARRLGARTRRVVLQNLWWAGGYNLTAVPLAALGLVPPWMAAIGMSLSSLIVVGNSLRLRAARSRDTAQAAEPAADSAPTVRGAVGPIARSNPP